jgi:hypothetical protein
MAVLSGLGAEVYVIVAVHLGRRPRRIHPRIASAKALHVGLLNAADVPGHTSEYGKDGRIIA